MFAHRATTNQIIELLQQSVVGGLGRDWVGYGRVVFDHGLRVEFEFHGHGLRTRHLSGLAQGRVTHTVEANSARRVGVGGRLGRRLWRRRSWPVEAFGLPPPTREGPDRPSGGWGLSALNTPCSVSTTPVPCLPPLVPYLPPSVPCLPPPSLPPPRWPVPTPRPNRRLWRNGSLAACALVYH